MGAVKELITVLFIARGTGGDTGSHKVAHPRCFKDPAGDVLNMRLSEGNPAPECLIAMAVWVPGQ